jgi:hypothetical protein
MHLRGLRRANLAGPRTLLARQRPVDVDVACDVLHEEEREDHAPCSADPGRPDPRA